MVPALLAAVSKFNIRASRRTLAPIVRLQRPRPFDPAPQWRRVRMLLGRMVPEVSRILDAASRWLGLQSWPAQVLIGNFARETAGLLRIRCPVPSCILTPTCGSLPYSPVPSKFERTNKIEEVPQSVPTRSASILRLLKPTRNSQNALRESGDTRPGPRPRWHWQGTLCAHDADESRVR